MTFYGQVIEHCVRPGKKDDFLQMLLRTQEGLIQFVIWSVADVPGNPIYPQLADILQIDTYKDQRGTTFHNVIIEVGGFKKISREEMPAEYKDAVLGGDKPSPERLLAAAQAIFDKNLFSKTEHYRFLQECINHIGIKRFNSCPAAKSVHHDYEGGLLIHTSEVLNFAKASVSALPDSRLVSKDVVYLGAILHDIGKVYTYYMDALNMPQKSVFEEAVGHIYYGMHVVQSIGEKHVGSLIEQWFLDELLHVIASHHGRVEWGSIKTPMSLEAIIVSQADYLSSRTGIISNRKNEKDPVKGTLGFRDPMLLTHALANYGGAE